jgi:hypothetical protein
MCILMDFRKKRNEKEIEERRKTRNKNILKS